jgi:hypothetical protein
MCYALFKAIKKKNVQNTKKSSPPTTPHTPLTTGHVLDFLRDGRVVADQLDLATLTHLKREFDFYGLDCKEEVEVCVCVCLCDPCQGV